MNCDRREVVAVHGLTGPWVWGLGVYPRSLKPRSVGLGFRGLP